QLTLDDEALRRLDVLEVDAAEGRLEARDDVDELVRVALVHLDVEDVDPGELLEEHALAFHHRLRRQWPDRAEPQHRGPVRDDGHEVAAGGQIAGLRRIGGDRVARQRHARGVRQRKVGLVHQALGGGDGDLAWYRKLVIFESNFTELVVHGHTYSPRALKGAA